VPLALDSDLIERARDGGDALDALVAAVWPEAYRIAVGILRDPDLAEDVAQDACAAIVRSLPSLKNSGSFASWSYRTIVNAAITAARRHPRVQGLDAVADAVTTFDSSDAIDVRNALAGLSAVQRAVAILHYYIGFDSREIAIATSLPSSTVRFHLMLARRALRRALSPDEPATLSPDEVLPHVR
jgi:RNA polymerase sigma-70 factor (ECF subfamily)